MPKLYVIDWIPEQAEDVTLRMARVLRHAAFVACGDASWLRERLRALGFDTPVLELAADPSARAGALVAGLQRGEGVWVCGQVERDDGGTVRALALRGVELACVPGPEAAISALAVSGLPLARVTLLGMLPTRAAERRALFRPLGDEEATLVCHVPAGSLAEVLGEIEQELGQRRVAVARPDETLRTTTGDGAEDLDGACVLVVAGAAEAAAWTEQRVSERAGELLDAGGSARDVAQEIARASGWPKREVYALVLRIRAGSGGQDGCAPCDSRSGRG